MGIRCSINLCSQCDLDNIKDKFFIEHARGMWTPITRQYNSIWSSIVKEDKRSNPRSVIAFLAQAIATHSKEEMRSWVSGWSTLLHSLLLNTPFCPTLSRPNVECTSYVIQQFIRVYWLRTFLTHGPPIGLHYRVPRVPTLSPKYL